jgi:RNA polymerase sigma-70 factor (ECF subfamily)
MVSNNIKNPESSEQELVSRLKEGQQEAYRQLIRRYQSKLINIAYGVTLDREESQDIVQDVFLKVYKNIRSFEGKSKLITWIYRITINESLNWQRRWKRRFRWQHDSIENEDLGNRDLLMKDEFGPEEIYRKKELEKILNQELNKLSKDVRAILILKELEGLSYDEIAKLMGINKGTVSSRLFYAREKLKQSLLEVLDKED